MSWYDKAVDNNEQEPIWFKDVMNLGFTNDIVGNDEMWYNQYGYDYAIVSLEVSIKPEIIIYWHQETRKCDLMRMDKECNVKAVYRIKNKEELIKIVNFYKQ